MDANPLSHSKNSPPFASICDFKLSLRAYSVVSFCCKFKTSSSGARGVDSKICDSAPTPNTLSLSSTTYPDGGNPIKACCSTFFSSSTFASAISFSSS